MASQNQGSVYIGMTTDLTGRVYDHKMKIDPKSHTAKYNINRLVWFEDFDDINDAILMEKRLKKWLRAWKIELIKKTSAAWQELCPETGSFL